jgi:spore coat protein CotH
VTSTPLIEFLDFVNNASDEEFAAASPIGSTSRLRHVPRDRGVARQLRRHRRSRQQLLPVLRRDDGVATVVAWDHNLALTGGFPGAVGGGGGAGAVPGGGDQQGQPGPVGPDGGLPLPEGCELPDGFDPGAVPGGGAGGPSFGGGNPLVDRFHEVDAFEALYQQALVDVRASLFDSGTASDLLETEAQVLRDQASDLVDVATIDDEAASVEAQLDA